MNYGLTCIHQMITGADMHHYPFHIGDYRSSTAHLTDAEDLAYRRLIDFYMDTEQEIPLETQWVARRIRVDTEVVVERAQDPATLHRVAVATVTYVAVDDAGKPKKVPPLNCA